MANTRISDERKRFDMVHCTCIIKDERNAMDNQKIKEFRKSLGLTRISFGELLGVSHFTVYEWELGRRHPSKSAQILMKIIKDSNK